MSSAVEKRVVNVAAGKDVEKTPSMIQLTNLLHKYRDPAAQPVKEFVARHAGDPVFARRAKTLMKLFKLKQQLVK